MAMLPDRTDPIGRVRNAADEVADLRRMVEVLSNQLVGAIPMETASDEIDRSPMPDGHLHEIAETAGAMIRDVDGARRALQRITDLLPDRQTPLQPQGRVVGH